MTIPRAEAPADIRSLIRDEVERNAIAQALQPPPTHRSKLQKVLRHPLFLALFAFTLTTILGGAFNEALKQRDATLSAQRAAATELQANRASRRAQAFKAEEQAIAALNEFVTLVYQRSVAADLMRFALIRGAIDEAKEHRKAYEQAYIDWNVNLPQSLQELRRLVAVSPQDMNKPNPYERAANDIIDAWFGRERACLYATLDKVSGDLEATTGTCPEPWEGATEQASHMARACARAILAGMSGDIHAVTIARAAGNPPPKLDQPDHLFAACKEPS